MDHFLSFKKISNLKMFSSTHLTVVLLIFLFWTLTICYIKIKNKRNNYKDNKNFRYSIAALLILLEIISMGWQAATGQFSIQESLPLHLCDITAFTCAFMLISENQLLFQINYYAGIGGAIQAIITPSELPNFPHIDFYIFFIYHTLLILSVLYMIFIKKFIPEGKSIFKALLALNLYMVILYPFNAITGSNYMFINRTPDPPNLIDPFLTNIFGPSPYYIIGLEILVLILFSVMFIPFLIRDLAFIKKI